MSQTTAELSDVLSPRFMMHRYCTTALRVTSYTHIPVAILAQALPLLIDGFEGASYISANFNVSVKNQSTCIYFDCEVYYSGGGYRSLESADQAKSLKVAGKAVLILLNVYQVHNRLRVGNAYIVAFASIRLGNRWIDRCGAHSGRKYRFWRWSPC